MKWFDSRSQPCATLLVNDNQLVEPTPETAFERFSAFQGGADMAPAASVRSMFIEDYVRLFRGDVYSDGYAHEGLALQVCERMGPRNKRDLIERFYPEFKGEKLQLDAEVEQILAAGYEKWELLGKPRVGRTGRKRDDS